MLRNTTEKPASDKADTPGAGTTPRLEHPPKSHRSVYTRSNTHASQKMFQCTFCQEKAYQGSGVNRALMSMVEEALKLPQKLSVICDLHPSEVAEYFTKGRLVC